MLVAAWSLAMVIIAAGPSLELVVIWPTPSRFRKAPTAKSELRAHGPLDNNSIEALRIPAPQLQASSAVPLGLGSGQLGALGYEEAQGGIWEHQINKARIERTRKPPHIALGGSCKFVYHDPAYAVPPEQG